MESPVTKGGSLPLGCLVREKLLAYRLAGDAPQDLAQLCRRVTPDPYQGLPDAHDRDLGLGRLPDNVVDAAAQLVPLVLIQTRELPDDRPGRRHCPLGPGERPAAGVAVLGHLAERMTGLVPRTEGGSLVVTETRDE